MPTPFPLTAETFIDKLINNITPFQMTIFGLVFFALLIFAIVLERIGSRP